MLVVFHTEPRPGSTCFHHPGLFLTARRWELQIAQRLDVEGGREKNEYEYGVWMGLAITAIREIHQAAQTNLISIHRHRLVCNKNGCCVFSEPNRWQISPFFPSNWENEEAEADRTLVTKTDFRASASFWKQYESNQVELRSWNDSKTSRRGVSSRPPTSLRKWR